MISFSREIKEECSRLVPLHLTETIWKDKYQLQHKHKYYWHLNAIQCPGQDPGTEKGHFRKIGEIQSHCRKTGEIQTQRLYLRRLYQC